MKNEKHYIPKDSKKISAVIVVEIANVSYEIELNELVVWMN